MWHLRHPIKQSDYTKATLNREVKTGN